MLENQVKAMRKELLTCLEYPIQESRLAILWFVFYKSKLSIENLLDGIKSFFLEESRFEN